MANLFLASEILEINIAEERNGATYYLTLAQATKDKTIEQTFLDIAEQEKIHEKRFTEMLKTVENREPEESYPGEFDAYLNALKGKKMFADEKQAKELALSKSGSDAVQFAIETEKATLSLLAELIKHISDNEKHLVQLTIEEEQGHITQLDALLAEL